MDLVYLDNNATTQPAPEVVAAMLPFLTDFYGNPSSVHRFGQRSRQAIDVARGQIAALIGSAESELTFTGGGTESINTVIRGLLASRFPRKRIVTTTVEHSATRELCAQLARDGAEIVAIEVNEQGLLDIDALRSAVSDDTALVTLMWANNETGVLFPVAEVAALCREKRVPFHCDATQAVGKLPIDVKAIGLDAMSFASHKFHGPKGVGAFYARRGLRVRPLIVGGPQEQGRRGGTENVPGVVGMGRAAELAAALLAAMPGVARLRDRLERSILETIDGTRVNGSIEHRLPNTTNIAFPRLEAEAILLLLSEQDVCASAGAACSSGSLEPSHVLRAMRIDEKLAHGAIRFSLSRYSTDAEVDRALDVVPGVIRRLRAVLPVG
ncbi:cysteine desulfurase family protein [Humisphaera borealis]|uniref:cysteine desulfurase n=1 Tax=Humisphaera borealis TaxID=2807512 RepID=A0A7M2WSD2_9BACT|nr:aminotransferase class V-fold PLP-dependent enzyme [Humisphaera borealis]QOV87711.1 aminotransferase class V-fold PLP-dependent enzyme [Humisphaera borealis]